MHDNLSAYAPPTVYPTHERPLVDVLVQGSWVPAEVRMWCQGLDGWRAEAQLAAPDRRRIVTVPAAEVRGHHSPE